MNELLAEALRSGKRPSGNAFPLGDLLFYFGWEGASFWGDEG